MSVTSTWDHEVSTSSCDVSHEFLRHQGGHGSIKHPWPPMELQRVVATRFQGRRVEVQEGIYKEPTQGKPKRDLGQRAAPGNLGALCVRKRMKNGAVQIVPWPQGTGPGSDCVQVLLNARSPRPPSSPWLCSWLWSCPLWWRLLRQWPAWQSSCG